MGACVLCYRLVVRGLFPISWSVSVSVCWSSASTGRCLHAQEAPEEPSKVDAYRAAFDAFDADSSGAISVSELRNVLSHLGQEASDEDVEAMIEAAADGEDTLSFEQLCKMLSSHDARLKVSRRALVLGWVQCGAAGVVCVGPIASHCCRYWCCCSRTHAHAMSYAPSGEGRVYGL
jgi:hypothetical protein